MTSVLITFASEVQTWDNYNNSTATGQYLYIKSNIFFSQNKCRNNFGFFPLFIIIIEGNEL